MMKFKKGDIVRVTSTGCASVGNVGVVVEVGDNKTRPYKVMFLEATSEYAADELEKVCRGN